MANPHRGEAEVEIGGEVRTMRVDFNVLVNVGRELKTDGLKLAMNAAGLGNPEVVRAFLCHGLRAGDKSCRRLTIERVGEWMTEGKPGMAVGEWFSYLCEALAEALMAFAGVDKESATEDPPEAKEEAPEGGP